MQALTAAVAQLKVGDGMRLEVTQGPLINVAAAEKVNSRLMLSIIEPSIGRVCRLEIRPRDLLTNLMSFTYWSAPCGLWGCE